MTDAPTPPPAPGTAPARRPTSLRGPVSGFGLPLEAARMLARERRLWAPALAPFLLSIAAFATALSLIVAYAGELYGVATGWMPALEVARWYAWLWIGPAKLLFAAVGAVFFLVVAGGCLVAAYLVASLLAAPFHDALAQRVEQLVEGRVSEESRGFLRDALRSLREEARRLLFFLAVVGPLAVVGLIVPGAQLLTGPAIVAFTVLFLPLDYASYTLDRRRWSFPDKRRWVMENVSVMAGFGGAAFLTCLVPVLNFAAMPLLVVAGTLLALRLGPPAPDAPATRGA